MEKCLKLNPTFADGYLFLGKLYK